MNASWENVETGRERYRASGDAPVGGSRDAGNPPEGDGDVSGRQFDTP